MWSYLKKSKSKSLYSERLIKKKKKKADHITIEKCRILDWLNSCVLLKEPNKVKTYHQPLPVFFLTYQIIFFFLSFFQTNILMDNLFWWSSKQDMKRLRRTMFLFCRVNYCTSIFPGNAPKRFCCAWQRVFGPPHNDNDSHYFCRRLESIQYLI